MKYKQLEKTLKEVNCRLEKFEDEDGNKTVAIYAEAGGVKKKSNADAKDVPNELKIINMSTNNEKSFDDVADAIHQMLLKSGIRLTLMTIAETMDNPEQSKILDGSGQPIKKKFTPEDRGGQNSPQ